MIALLGQTSMHEVQLPQWFSVYAWSISKGMLVKISPRKNQEPAFRLRSKVFLTSPSSIIRIGCDGGLVSADGSVSEARWWYQRRLGEKVYAELYSGSRVWVEWVALDFGRWPWQFGQAVVIARDSVEDVKDFQRLKRMLRSR